MPAERCPRCGTARTAGSCACDAPSAAEETAVLPHLEGPPLVRPYVTGAPLAHPVEPGADPFATRLGPPSVQPITAPAVAPPPPPPGRPPRVPQAASPFGPPQPAPQPVPAPPPAAAPHPDAAPTQLLPPVPPQGAPGRFVPTPTPPPAAAGDVPTTAFALGPVTVPPQPPAPADAGYPHQPPGEPVEATQLIQLDPPDEEWPAQPGADLGMFTFREDGTDAPVSRAGRREQRRQSADRRRLVIAGGAVGVTALGASLAMLLSASPSTVDNALPAPTGPAVSSPVEVSPSPGDPTSEASPAPSASDSPSPTRTTARPSQTVTTRAATVPTAGGPSAPSSPATPTGPASPSSGRVLRFGDTGPEVTQMQQALMAYRCNLIGQLTLDRTRTNQLGFGDWTRQVLVGVQQDLFGPGKPKGYQEGVYDAPTQAALQATPRSATC